MISVIGGAGFIGTNLCRRFQRNCVSFQIIDKVQSKAFPHLTNISDVRNLDALRRSITGDFIINLAAEHRDDVRPKSLYTEVNVEGAKNICYVAEEKKINKIIFTSSVAVYGFAPIGTDESGKCNPFNEYGKTKLLAEQVYKEWLFKDPKNRTLVIIRPTVVFGEGNRGNVYNLLNQIASGRFLMVGDGTNVKSMAYVENVAAFIEYSLNFQPGLHIYNYVDKPDFDINTLITTVYKTLGRGDNIRIRIPFWLGYIGGKFFDFLSLISGKQYPISSIRIKKFCSSTSFNTAILTTGFKSPVNIKEGLIRTIKHEFIEKKHKDIFYSE